MFGKEEVERIVGQYGVIAHDDDNPIVFFILLTFLVKGNRIMLREQIFVIIVGK